MSDGGRRRGWAIAGALSITETVSYGVLYYAFAAFLVPMHEDLGWSTAQLTGAFSLAILISAVAGIPVGRYLDRRGPRGLMTAGAAAGALLVLAWSRVEGLAAFYAVWAGLGLVMAAVLYEAAFTVLAKHFGSPAERRTAMTAVTLVAAFASFIFVPLSQALIDAHGWRDALAILAAILAATTVPLHALVLRAAPAEPHPERAHAPSAAAREVLRTPDFWMLSTAFFLAQLAAIGTMVLAIPFLLERGHDPEFAALAVGLFGISQIPGRIVFAPLAGRVSPAATTGLVFGLVAAGIAVAVAIDAAAAVVAGFVLLGMGNGMATLARATVIADRYGQAAYGTIAGVAGAVTIAARAAAPVAAALYATAFGYPALLWTLAALAAAAAVVGYRAELAAPLTR
ncbi:MAG TPA: MFS transporter [Solirubrobacteraceae bacterium]|nr:MFS transporter [Solirubrobacteraceae bacterium]